ncbi:MAG: hypothetical protein GF418_06470 [Chitinivibrionales bacterium]|nr:hypothetical protein [Chitinivibrionales bacterium]MBD3395254.1 hypothetical protein [Chitinivibrionales bacterium]
MKWWPTLRKKPVRHRTRHVEFCPVVFKHGDNTYSAFLIDLSAEGAKLRAPVSEGGSHITANEEITMDIKTPYGTSSCKGKVLWGEEHKDGYRWGVQLTEVPKDESDPIQLLINSPLG